MKRVNELMTKFKLTDEQMKEAKKTQEHKSK